MEKLEKIMDVLSSDKAFRFTFGALAVILFACGFFNPSLWILSAAFALARLII